jgi:hypothetical protein
MKIKVKFANKEVNIKNLVQGSVVIQEEGSGFPPTFYHIHRFNTRCDDGSIDLIIADDFGKWEKNSKDLIWPI